MAKHILGGHGHQLAALLHCSARLEDCACSSVPWQRLTRGGCSVPKQHSVAGGGDGAYLSTMRSGQTARKAKDVLGHGTAALQVVEELTYEKGSDMRA